MKKIGILGGIAPESTAEYYRLLISQSKERGWGKKYPVIIVYSLNFEEFYEPLKNVEYSEVISILSQGINSLERAGADFALMASNTPHMFFDEVKNGSSIPLLSIVDATAGEAKRNDYEKVGLLGTKFTMEGDFYRRVFEDKGIELVVPAEEERNYLNRIIFGELTQGDFKEKTKEKLVRIVGEMEKEKGIDSVALACTELPLILSEDVLDLPVLNTTKIHAQAALEYSVEG